MLGTMYRDLRHLLTNRYYLIRVAYRIFLWGGGHISAASRGSSGMLPQKIVCILRWTLT